MFANLLRVGQSFHQLPPSSFWLLKCKVLLQTRNKSHSHSPSPPFWQNMFNGAHLTKKRGYDLNPNWRANQSSKKESFKKARDNEMQDNTIPKKITTSERTVPFVYLTSILPLLLFLFLISHSHPTITHLQFGLGFCRLNSEVMSCHS